MTDFRLFRSIPLRLGLRKAPMAGESSGPFGDWELLLARLAARGEEGRSLSRVRRLLLGETSAALDSTARSDLDPGHARALAGLMRGLREGLEG